MNDFICLFLIFLVKKQSVPVVPWNAEQNSILLYQPFILLLHKLGFHLPADAGKLFVRIPEFWTADILFNVAEKLGPIDKCNLLLFFSFFFAFLSLSALYLTSVRWANFNFSNTFCLACLKFDVNELNVLPPRITMYGPINQGKNIDMSQEQIDATNRDLNFTFPTNALNTSSIIRYDNWYDLWKPVCHNEQLIF